MAKASDTHESLLYQERISPLLNHLQVMEAITCIVGSEHQKEQMKAFDLMKLK